MEVEVELLTLRPNQIHGQLAALGCPMHRAWATCSMVVESVNSTHKSMCGAALPCSTVNYTSRAAAEIESGGRNDHSWGRWGSYLCVDAEGGHHLWKEAYYLFQRVCCE